MRALKIIALVLLIFFLCISLAAFGPLFSANMTVLSPNYITSRIDDLDLSQIAQEAFDQQADKGELPPELADELIADIVDTVDRLEPVLKDRLDTAVHSVYDYLLSHKEDPELAQTLRDTFWSPEFVAAFLEEINISSLAESYLNSDNIKQDLPPELTDELIADLVDTIDRLEPILKERVEVVAGPIFDYLLGISQELDLTALLRENLMDDELVSAILNEIDIPTLVADFDLSSFALDFLEEQSSGELPVEIEYLAGYMDDIVIELGTWFKEQVALAADPLFDYLLDYSSEIDVIISMAPVKDALGDGLKQKFVASPPQELAGLSQTQLEQYFDQYFGDIAGNFPIALEFDISVMADAQASIIDAINDATSSLMQAQQDIDENLTEVEDAFSESRQYIGYFKLAYTLLVVFMLLLVAGIILVHRRVKTASLTLSCVFLAFGFIDLIGAIIGRAQVRTALEQAEDITPALRDWIANTAASALTPMLVLGIVLLLLGGGLLAVYIIYDRREKATPSFPYISPDEDQ